MWLLTQLQQQQYLQLPWQITAGKVQKELAWNTNTTQKYVRPTVE